MATAVVVAETPGAKPVGQVRISFEIANNFDLMSGGQVRSLVVRDALMDTGATLLALPAEFVAELGLPYVTSIVVELAAGSGRFRLFQGALIAFEDRSARVDVLELPSGSEPLFGVIPMELLGIEPNTREREIRRFPMGEGGRSYFRA